MTKPMFDLTVGTAGAGVAAAVTGEIDVTNAADFARAVNAVPGPRPLIVDLSAVRYLDSAGFAVLDELLGHRAVVIVLSPDSPISSAATLMGVPCHPSVDAAAHAS